MVIPNLENLQIVSEEIIEYCAKQIQDDPENNFSKFLEVAKEYRKAGLTPIFLCSETLKDLIVTTEERLRKKLH